MSFTISINDQAAFEVQFAGPAGPTGPQGPQGIQGVPGEGVAVGGTTGQVLKKASNADYDTVWSSDISGVSWGGITGTLSAQTDLQNALDAKLSTSSASSTYLPLAGGYITGDLQSNNGSGYRTWDGGYKTANLQPEYLQLNNAGVGGNSLTIEWDGISFADGKQTVRYPGTGVLDGLYYPLSSNPAGYLTSAALSGLATESWVTAGFYPLTGNPSGFITSSALTGYATESWVTTQLGSYLTTSAASSTYLPLAGGTITGNIISNNGSQFTTSNGTYSQIEISPYSITLNNSDIGGNNLYVEWDGITFPSGKQTVHYPGTSILSGYATESWVGLNFYPITGNPSGFLTDAPSDGYIYGRQNGAWVSTGGGGSVWGSITGTLSDQTDLQSALDSKYDASNPAGYTTEGWVNSQGFLTTAILDGYAQLSGSIYTGEITFAAATFGRLNLDTLADNGTDTFSRITFGTGSATPTSVSNGDFWFNGTYLQYGQGGTKTVASQSWVTSQGYLTSSALTGYAQLAGATFTGKVNAVASTSVSAGFNLGSGVAPTAPLAGDLWTAGNTDTLRYRAPLTNQTFDVAVRNATNTFSSPNIIDTTATTAALRVTQKGTGNAIEIEDSTTPDATRFVVDQFGKVGVGTAPDATAAIKVDSNGISFNGLVFNPTATAAHSGGSDTLDLLVTINGTNYRIGLRPA